MANLQILFPNGQVLAVLTYFKDPITGDLIPWDGSGGGGGGGAVTIANGADAAEGNVSDVAWVSGDGTVISLLKKIASAGGGAVSIADGSDIAEGAKADAVWSGSGAGSVISILKKIALGSSSSVTVVDGADTVEGSLADAADLVGVAGTVNSKLRGLVQLLAELLAVAEQDPSLGGLAVNIGDGIGHTLHIGVDGELKVIYDGTQHNIIDSGTITAVTAITNALPVGANVIGKVGIDQTTPGTTNKVTIGSDVVHVIVDSGVTSGLTDAQLRATPVPVSGSLTGTMTGSMEVKGQVNQFAQDYSEADIQPLSMTMDGRLRVSTSLAGDDVGSSAWDGILSNGDTFGIVPTSGNFALTNQMTIDNVWES